jgi:hypothetical protein
MTAIRNTAPKATKKKAPKDKRSSNVPGQFYGYSIQVTRVVAHLLRAQQGQSVSIEHLDDVATHNGTSDLVEQDKSGLAHNPVTDRSPELWKSLANWVRAIRAGALKEDARFLLYVAQGHRGKLIDSIHSATTKAAADAVVVSIRSTFDGKEKLPKGLAEHVKEVLSVTDEVLARLFVNITLENGSGAPNDDLAATPGMAAISQAKKDEVLTYLLGWAKKTVDKHIEHGQAAVIKWESFHKSFVAAAKKFDRAENVLVASPIDVTEGEVQKELRDRTYVRQLQVVRCDDDETVRAVHDYLRSVTHRTNWSEDGDVIKSSFDEFEGSLGRAWANQRSIVDIEQKTLADAERGRLLYAKCQLLKVPLQGMDVPDFFVPGSFHTMADSLRIGWHPRFREAIAAFVPGMPANDHDEVGAVPPVSAPKRKDKLDSAPPAAAAAGGGSVDERGGA